MLNYDVDPELLRPHVPAGTELHLWHGQAVVSVVAFRFLRTRVLGLSFPWHRDFDEVNLRLYVRRRLDDGGWRRGVVFIKEIVPRRVVAAVARLVFDEPYVRLPMRHELRVSGAVEGQPSSIRYEWRTGSRWNRVAVTLNERPSTYAVGSEQEFITEHSWGYTAHERRPTTEYRVDHPNWRIWNVGDHEFDCDVECVYGAAYAPFLTAAPRSAFVAEGSDVTVYLGRELEGAGRDAVA